MKINIQSREQEGWGQARMNRIDGEHDLGFGVWLGLGGKVRFWLIRVFKEDLSICITLHLFITFCAC